MSRAYGTRRTSRPRRRRGPIYLLVAVVFFGALGGMGYAFNNYVNESPRFQVKSVRVEGANALREAAVLEVAGITSADNLLLFNADRIRERIEILPYVRECSVQRAYPDTVIIRLTERVPVATLMVNNHSYELDEEGVILRELAPLAPHVGPLVTNVPRLGVLEPGMQVKHPALCNALAVWMAFAMTSMGRELTVSEIAAPAADYISMYLDEVPFEIRWGRSDYKQQAQLLDILWDEKQGRLECTEYVDLRFDNDIICK